MDGTSLEFDLGGFHDAPAVTPPSSFDRSYPGGAQVQAHQSRSGGVLHVRFIGSFVPVGPP